ncbi:MAG TPA: hypothetical protein VF918_01245 [Anaerolineales bacterium]
MKKIQAKQQLALLAGVFLVILMGCGGPPATPTQSGVVISTFTAAPVNSPAPSEASQPTLAPTPNSEVMGQLPGLSPVNVTVSLEGQKFTCTAVKKVTVYYERTCLRGLPSVNLIQIVISGRETSIVDFIEISILQNENPENKTAHEVLGFIAAMPYDGADPEEARAWVESTIPAVSGKSGGTQEAVFGDVKYVLRGSVTALSLEIGEWP